VVVVRLGRWTCDQQVARRFDVIIAEKAIMFLTVSVCMIVCFSVNRIPFP